MAYPLCWKTTTVDQQIKEPEGKIRDVPDDDKNEPVMTAAPTPKPGHKISSVKPVTATKKPVVTRKPTPKPTKKPVKKPAAKPTRKPAPEPTKKPVTTPASDPAANTTDTPSTPDGSIPEQDGVETTTEDTTSQQNTDEDIDLGTK